MEIFGKVYKVDPREFILNLCKKFKIDGIDENHVKGMIFVKCPFHNHGQERTASANFSIINKGKTKEGDFHCFGCKVGGHISSILVKLFGDKRLAIDWIERMYGNLKGWIEEKRELRKIEIPKEVEEEKQVFDLPEEAYWYDTNYYGKRGIPDSLVNKFKLGYIHSEDSSKRRVYIPVFNSVGEVVFYMTRNIHNKQFYLPKGAKKVLWGANEITGNEVCITESVFNALTLWKNGRQAVAMFGTGFDGVVEQLLALPVRAYILCLDNDEAGVHGTNELLKSLRGAGRLVSTVFIDDIGKDLNDYANLSSEEFEQKWSSWIKRGI